MQYNFRHTLFLIITLCIFHNSNSQVKDTSKWKALFAIGVNMPLEGGFISEASAQSINLPTVNLGVQHMFKSLYGVRLDFGFNRFKSEKNTPEFKINYSRINAQFVLDPSDYIGLSTRIRTILHAGPGYTFVKPLGNLGDNKQSYLNAILGLELHYAINEKLSIYTDLAYIYGFTSLESYNPSINGLGAFNSSVINLTIGLAVSLSGCQYCD